MGSQSNVADKSEIETSQVASCDSKFQEEVKTSVSEESFLQGTLEKKEQIKKSLSEVKIYDLENNKGDVAEPITPKGDILEMLICSEVVSDDGLSLGCETPRESIFDPFAPGPEDAACAPKKKVIRGPEFFSRRQLNFDSGDYPVKRLSFDWNDSEEEDQYLQVIQKMILDLFISDGSVDEQEETKEILIDSSPHESCKTPVSQPLLTGIATTCPDAPLRSSLKVFKLSPSICRKIDFDSVCDSVNPRSSVVKENK